MIGGVQYRSEHDLIEIFLMHIVFGVQYRREHNLIEIFSEYMKIYYKGSVNWMGASQIIIASHSSNIYISTMNLLSKSFNQLLSCGPILRFD